MSVVSWLVAVGSIAIGAAIGVWGLTDVNRTFVIWLIGIPGVICLVIALGFELQKYSTSDAEDPQRATQVEESRANIKLVYFFTTPIQDRPQDPLKGYAAQALLKNFGKTDARGTRVAISYKFLTASDPFPSDAELAAPEFPPDAATADVARDVEFASDPKFFEMGVFDDVRSGRIRIMLFGEVRYADIYPGTKPHVTTFCAFMNPKNDPRIVYPSTGAWDGPFDFQVCPHHNSSF
jgi:hypothetical protein